MNYSKEVWSDLIDMYRREEDDVERARIYEELWQQANVKYPDEYTIPEDIKDAHADWVTHQELMYEYDDGWMD